MTHTQRDPGQRNWRQLMTTENWHEERDRLIRLLKAVKLADVTHVDERGQRQLQPTNSKNVAELERRLALLNSRLGDGQG